MRRQPLSFAKRSRPAQESKEILGETSRGRTMATKTEVFLFSEFGAPEVLTRQSRSLPDPTPGEVQIRHLAIGVNYIDIYHRRGVFAAPLALPSGLGVEGVGADHCLG
jgi:NADPH2:quinone reductase